MDLYSVRFTTDGIKLRGVSGPNVEALSRYNVEFPTDRVVLDVSFGDFPDLLDHVVDELALFSDNLHVNTNRLRRRLEQGELFPLPGAKTTVRNSRRLR
uniref:Uncharacterized protein n=1 Tax=uncultured prokaryote TaxID=198431 RepID=A0A0H5QL59_9ZZZZ|nr:hypothetical protein [uncultured prokaryote]